MDKIINNTRGIELLITDTFLEFINIDSNLVIDLNKYMNIYNNTEYIKLLLAGDLRFGLRTYDEFMPVYTIVLNFMFETGGVF